MTFAKSERAGLCDLLDQVGPDAPTLCDGWSSHDLAAHLWVRENDPVGASGILAKPLAGLTERRMGEVTNRWSYTELVERIRRGPTRFSVFAIPGVDEPANATEYFVHHEDVRRAGTEPRPPRELPTDIEDWIWRRMKLLGRALFRRVEVGVVLERADAPLASGEPDSVRATPGSRIVTLVGRPSELLLFGNGRDAAADVQLIGEAEAIETLTGSDRSI